MFDHLLTAYDTSSFHQIAQMNFTTFCWIVDLIKDSPVFQTDSESQFKQWPVWQQTIICFERLGHYSSGASVGQFAQEFGIGVGTIVLYTHRIVDALFALVDRYV